MPEGKIIKALSGFYYVLSGDKVVQCRGRGVFRKNKITPLVGDYVVYQAENDLEGYIMEVRPRKNELVRPPVANIDQALLVFSAARPEFSTLLLDRFLSIVEANDIDPVICITKMDLMDEEDMARLQEHVENYRSIGYEVVLLSSEDARGQEELAPFLKGNVSVLAGQSGVGKSTLLNLLRPELDIKTADISNHLGRGKHTTRHVELLNVKGGLVADTPGFSSLEFPDIEMADLSHTFPEISRNGEMCKFRGCLHVNEPGCAVKHAVEQADISLYRYEHYLLFLEEIKNRKPRY